MIGIVLHLCLGCGPLLLGLMAPVEDEKSKSVRKELKPLLTHEEREEGIVPPLRAYLEYDVRQPARGGVVVVLELANFGAEPVELVDVPKGFSIWLYNADGVDVSVPDPDREEVRSNCSPFKKRADWTQRPGYSLMHPPKAWRDPKIKVVQEAINNDDKIRLEPGEKFQTALLVNRVLCEPKKYHEEQAKRTVPIEEADPDLPPLDPPAVCDIQPGTYKVGVSCSARKDKQFPSWSFGFPEVYTIELVADDPEAK